MTKEEFIKEAKVSCNNLQINFNSIDVDKAYRIYIEEFRAEQKQPLVTNTSKE